MVIWIVILSILGILCVLSYLRSVEGFQLKNIGDIQFNFWEILNAKNQPEVSAAIAKVRFPSQYAKKEEIPVKFGQYISIYALAKYNYDPVAARDALFNSYDTLQSEMSTNLYNKNIVAAWDADLKGQTCAQLDNLMNTFTGQVTSLTKSIQDLSGTAVLAGSMRDENMAYQLKHKRACTNPTSPACMSLASQEGPLFSLLAQYNTVNHSLFSKEYDLSNNIQMLQETYYILDCKNPNPKATFQVDTSGYIDTTTLLMKLQDLSPYYLSPDILDYITENIISANDAKAAIAQTSNLYINMASTINNIKALTNTQDVISRGSGSGSGSGSRA
jgi:hypothetical protein